ncbi:MAG TPA: hypothetical protein K8W01_14960 [Methylorubrum populi]|uniref:Uncharacterized protein n=1 Tax=Methylorubrum populi TaxID=223967 RepID=A0A921JGE3_9HYPH|nr:hypothetical protein [Methylorubrum populi]
MTGCRQSRVKLNLFWMSLRRQPQAKESSPARTTSPRRIETLKIEGPIPMASASDCTRTPSSGGPVTRAIAAVRGKGYDATIDRMLANGDTARQNLSTLSIGGLYSLFQAHDAASFAFTHEANSPRAGADVLSSNLLDEIADHHHRGLEAIIAEIEQRRPNDSLDRAIRFKLLGAWHAGCEDWSAVARLAAEASAASRCDASGG